MIRHHPEDELLLGLAAGRLPAGPAAVVCVHLDGCGECRARLHTLQAVGGAVLEDAGAIAPSAGAWERTLARIDAKEQLHAPAANRSVAMANPPQAWPTGAQWPSSLRGCEVSNWKWMGPGMRYARVQVPHAADAPLFLLRIGPGRSLPRHGHHGNELTAVLYGSFEDGRATFEAGDFDAADGEVRHQPVVRAQGECICLAWLDAPLRFEGRIAGLIGGWLGM
jgi:putative transcriptional regulator